MLPRITISTFLVFSLLACTTENKVKIEIRNDSSVKSISGHVSSFDHKETRTEFKVSNGETTTVSLRMPENCGGDGDFVLFLDYGDTTTTKRFGYFTNCYPIADYEILVKNSKMEIKENLR